MGKEPMPVFVFGCVTCGKTVSGNERTCPRCGTSFEGVMFECPFCGELVSPIQRRCESCGTEFAAFSEDVSETSAVDLDGSGSPVSDSAPSASEPAEAEEAPAETVEFECPICSKPVAENDTKCPHCGALFQ
jgi:DNA-directed RNA polymerase subunit RPC12/RpoP